MCLALCIGLSTGPVYLCPSHDYIQQSSCYKYTTFTSHLLIKPAGRRVCTSKQSQTPPCSQNTQNGQYHLYLAFSHQNLLMGKLFLWENCLKKTMIHFRNSTRAYFRRRRILQSKKESSYFQQALPKKDTPKIILEQQLEHRHIKKAC